MIYYKFSKEVNSDFSRVLKKRINDYFKEFNIGKNANADMVIKTIVALSFYLVPFILILTPWVSSIPLYFALWAMMGLGNAFVGTSVMHDAVHGAYSRNRRVNNIIALTAPLLGMDARVWKIQHNVLHHTYTNIEDNDEDIAPRFVMRFSPHQPKKWFHRFQHIYVWFFYSLSTLLWALMKDYFKIAHYKKEKLVKPGKEYNTILAKMIFNKLLYFIIFLGLPLYFIPLSPGLIVLMFVSMHLVSGLALSLIFQPAHVISTSEFLQQDEKEIKENWFVHQLKTTTNFGMNNKLLTYVCGGLNYQVEHHLFPSICHIHYPEISKIVQETAREFNVPYHNQEKFTSAVANHYNTLKQLGRN